MLNCVITTNGLLSKNHVSKLALRHGCMDSFLTSMKKMSTKSLLQVQSNVVSLMLEALVKFYPQKLQ